MRNTADEVDLPPIVAIEDDESEETQPSSSRQSPVLAPLEVLQQTRGRGSITDPALHAVANTTTGKLLSKHHAREQEEESHANGDVTDDSDSSFDTPPTKRSTPAHGKKRKSAGESGSVASATQLVGRDGSATRVDGEAPAHKRRGSNTTLPSHSRRASADTHPISSQQSPHPNLPPLSSQPQWWGPPPAGYTAPHPNMHPYPWPQHPPPGMYVAFNPSNPHHHHHPPPPHLGILPPGASYGPPQERSPSESSPPAPTPVASSSKKAGRSRNTKAESPADSTPATEEASPPVKHSTYTRSPELRVSHKIAERKRRKAMKELFEDLQEHLPNDRGLKSSKWETLQRAIEHIESLQRRTEDMESEIGALRHEVDMHRQGAGLPLLNVAPPPLVIIEKHAPPPQTDSTTPPSTESPKPSSAPKDAEKVDSS